MDNKNQELAQELSNSFNKLNLIFHAILAIPLIAFVWLYLESKDGSVEAYLEDQSILDSARYLIPMVIIGGIAGALYVFKSGIRLIDPEKILKDKVVDYSKKAIIFFLMLEFGLVLSVLAFYMTQHDIFLAMFMIVLIFFSLYKPTLERMSTHLNIKGEEKSILVDCRSIARGEEKGDIIKL